MNQRAAYRRRGQGLTDYSVVIAIVAVVMILALNLLGGAVGTVFSTVNEQLAVVAPASTVAPSPTATPGPPSISGTVTDASGTPVYGANLDFWTSGGSYAGAYTTNAQGQYTANVSSGSYLVQMAGTAVGTQDAWLFNGYYSTSGYTTTKSDATAVSVDGPVSGIDIQLPPTYLVSGTITEASGTPLANTVVEASNGQVASEWGTGYQTAPYTTDALGRYSIPVTAGNWEVGAIDSGLYGYYSTSGVVFYSPAAGYPTTVNAAPVSGIDLQFPTTYTISGTVTDSSGNPVANLAAVGDNEGSPNPGARSGTVTDAQGRYQLTVVPGSWRVSVRGSATNWTTYYYSTSGTTSNSSSSTGVAVSSASVGGIDFSLP